MALSQTKEVTRAKIAKANMRLAWVLASIVLFSLFATFYFWPTPQIPT